MTRHGQRRLGSCSRGHWGLTRRWESSCACYLPLPYSLFGITVDSRPRQQRLTAPLVDSQQVPNTGRFRFGTGRRRHLRLDQRGTTNGQWAAQRRRGGATEPDENRRTSSSPLLCRCRVADMPFAGNSTWRDGRKQRRKREAGRKQSQRCNVRSRIAAHIFPSPHAGFDLSLLASR